MIRAVVLLLIMLLPALPARAQESTDSAAPESRVDRIRERVVSRVQDRIVPRIRDRAATRFRGRRGGHVRIGQNYTLGRDETSSESIVGIGGNAAIDGRVENDVVVVGGTLHLGPTAVVRGDATVVGGQMLTDQGAEVAGDVNNVSFDWRAMRPAWLDSSAGSWNSVALGATLLRLLITLAVSLLLTALFPRSIGRVSKRIETAPAASLALGFSAQILFVPALVFIAVALVITVIGIPLLIALPVAIGMFMVACAAGFAGSAAIIGATVRGTIPERPRIGDVLIGFAVLTAITVFGRVIALTPGWGPLAFAVHGVGVLIEYMGWTIGLGAAATAFFGRRRRITPPPLPVPARAI
jgi:hypothetical protein